MSGITTQDVPWLVYGVRRLRTETHGANQWDEAGIAAEIRQLVGHNFQITVERVFAHAADPTAKTPGAIRRPFTPERTPHGHSGPVRKADECRTHPGQPKPPFCGGCRADQLAGDEDTGISPAEELASQLVPNALTGPDAVRIAAGLPLRQRPEETP